MPLPAQDLTTRRMTTGQHICTRGPGVQAVRRLAAMTGSFCLIADAVRVRAGREPSMSQECECSDCGIGSSRPDNTELFCTLCPPGTHQASNGMATCDPCAAGQYSQETGRSMCTDCDAGTYSTAPGAVSAAACLACDPGKYSSSTGSDAETACQACPDHSGNNPAGSTSLASCKCNAGWAGAGGGPVCAVCPAGKISNTTGAVFCQRNVTRTCTPCP